MNKFAIDYESLKKDFSPQAKTKVYKLSEIDPSRMIKVAFDVVRFVDGDDLSGLWQIQEKDDGDYILAAYEDYLPEKVASDWQVYLDKTAHIQVFYKDEPIAKIASESFGFTDNEIATMVSMLPEKLATSQDLRQHLLQENLTPNQRTELFNKYPELKGTK